MCVNRINFDSEYWENELLLKLKDFFFNYALSFIVGQEKRAQSRKGIHIELSVTIVDDIIRSCKNRVLKI